MDAIGHDSSVRMEFRKGSSENLKTWCDLRRGCDCFRDPLAMIFEDEDHSEEEYREIVIGHSHQSRLLIVAFTEREDLIRIISARTATQKEREAYEETQR